MLNLLKYEFRKTQMAKLVLLGITAVAEIAFLIGLYSNRDSVLAISVGILVMAAFLGEMIIGLQSVITLHRDMNTKQGYMLFMTPHSSCAILGAKLLECSFSVMLTGAFYLVLGLIDIRLLLKESATLDTMVKYFTDFVRSFNASIPINFSGIASMIFMLLCSWISSVTTIYLSDVIASALLNGRKANGLIAFLIFIILNVAIGNIIGLIPRTLDAITLMLISGAANLVLAAVMYIVTFNLMDRYLSV